MVLVSAHRGDELGGVRGRDVDLRVGAGLNEDGDIAGVFGPTRMAEAGIADLEECREMREPSGAGYRVALCVVGTPAVLGGLGEVLEVEAAGHDIGRAIGNHEANGAGRVRLLRHLIKR
jgi:hypothetical protein